MATVDIIVPSYGREDILGVCLEALVKQSFQDFQILCVCRETDFKTKTIVADFCSRDQRVREVTVYQPGFVAALNAGLSSATAPFVCFTDDDAEAPPHWLQTLMDHFASHPECGAAGGPDRLQLPNKKLSDPPPAKKVGVYSWTGKWHATHHCPIREEYLRVSILKGVNMAYRHDLIRGMVIGEGLRSMMCTEPGIADRVRRQGFELHFLRDAWVLHHVKPRTIGEERTNYCSAYSLDTTFNYSYTLWRYQHPALSAVVQLRSLIIGNRHVPGLLRLLAAPGKAGLAVKHLAPALSGARDGWLARGKAP